MISIIFSHAHTILIFLFLIQNFQNSLEIVIFRIKESLI